LRMRRLVITVDESKCVGCGRCVRACLTNALALVNGKARLVNERLCDGFGSCIAACPHNALSLTYREAEEFDWSILMNVKLSDWIEKFRLTSKRL
jgi:Fe-S-cluster-containing hydrogenase component 2